MPQIDEEKIRPELPIKIAFCITDLDPGGAEWALFHIVTRLNKEKWSLHVFCLSSGGELVEKFKEQGIPVSCFGAKSSKDLRVFSWLTTELKNFAPHIVQGFMFHGNIVSRIAGYRAGIPIRVAGHRVAERQKRWHLRIDRFTKSLVHHHVCVSRGVADFVKDKLRLKEQQVSVITNGVDFKQKVADQNTIRQELGLSETTRIILAVGRLHPQKGFEELLWAFNEIANQIDDVHLLLVGNGPDKRKLESLMQICNLEGKVTLAGFRTDIPELMSEAEIYVLSSRWEGMPNVLLQAMQSELPIVATDVEGVSELIQDRITGRVVKPRDANGLWKSMEELLQDEVTQQEYSKNAKTLVMKEFTWEKIVNEYDLLYSLLINEVGSLQRA